MPRAADAPSVDLPAVKPAGLAPVEAAVASVPLKADFPEAAAEAPRELPGTLFPVSFLGSIFLYFFSLLLT